MSDFSKRQAGHIVVYVFLLAGTLFVLAPMVAFAQTAIPTPFTPQVPLPGTSQFSAGKPGVPVSPTLLADYIVTIYRIGLWLAITLAIFMMMVGGFLWVVSAGSPERVNNAKSYIGSSLTGLIVALSSFILLQTVNPELVVLKPVVAELKPGVLSDSGCCCWTDYADYGSAESCSPSNCKAPGTGSAEKCPKMAGTGNSGKHFDGARSCSSPVLLSAISHWDSAKPIKTVNYYGSCESDNKTPQPIDIGGFKDYCCVVIKQKVEAGIWQAIVISPLSYLYYKATDASIGLLGEQTCYNMPVPSGECCGKQASTWAPDTVVVFKENCSVVQRTTQGVTCDRGTGRGDYTSSVCKAR